MVRAILNGRKTMTRRIVGPAKGHQSNWLSKDDIYNVLHGEIVDGGWQMHHPHADSIYDGLYIPYNSPYGWIKCPYGKPGDILWVRETFWVNGDGSFIFKADAIDEEDYYLPTWKPSIHMPKKACRIKLRITGVRVERLKDISAEDAIKEGIIHRTMNDPIIEFLWLWESINGKGAWEKNPWVWVIEFEKLT